MKPALGEAIRLARQQRGQTQQALARAAGTNQATVSGVENAQLDARLSTLERLAQVLDLEVVLVPRDKLDAVWAAIPRPTAKPSSLRALFGVSDDDEPSQ